MESGLSGHSMQNEHSSSLRGHSFEVTPKDRPRSKNVSRNASYPAFCPDISYAVVEETQHRATVHRRILEKNPGAFRRTDAGGINVYIREKLKTHDMIGNLHPLNINKPVKKLPHFPESSPQDDAPLEDLSDPGNPTRPRTTGYSPGHIRSMLALQTYGPTDSRKTEIARQLGFLPASPNPDRYRSTSPGGSSVGMNSPVSTGSKAGVGGPWGTAIRNMHRPFSVKSERHNVSIKDSENITGRLETDDKNDISTHSMGTTIPSGTGKGFPPLETRSTAMTLTYEERLLNDPVAKSREWFQFYETRVQHKKETKMLLQNEANRRKKMKEEAEREEKNVEEFEASLKQKLARLYI